MCAHTQESTKNCASGLMYPAKMFTKTPVLHDKIILIIILETQVTNLDCCIELLSLFMVNHYTLVNGGMHKWTLSYPLNLPNIETTSQPWWSWWTMMKPLLSWVCGDRFSRLYSLFSVSVQFPMVSVPSQWCFWLLHHPITATSLRWTWQRHGGRPLSHRGACAAGTGWMWWRTTPIRASSLALMSMSQTLSRSHVWMDGTTAKISTSQPLSLRYDDWPSNSKWKWTE